MRGYVVFILGVTSCFHATSQADSPIGFRPLGQPLAIVPLDEPGLPPSVCYSSKNRYGLKTPQGTILTLAVFQRYISFPAPDSGYASSIACVELNNKWGWLRRDGLYVIRPCFDSLGEFSTDDQLAYAAVEGLYGFVNAEGEFVIPPMFRNAGSFGRGLAPAVKDELWGYVDKTGQWRVPELYDFAGRFRGERALVKRNGSWGYLDPLGREIIPITFKSATPFRNGQAYVQINGRIYSIDINGAIIHHVRFHR